MTNTRTPPAWAFDTGKAFNALWHKRRKEIEGAVAAWTAWERRHLHDDDKPAMPEAARLGYACAVMIGTINKVAADSPDVSMLAGMESTPVPDGLAGVCLAAVAPADWPASEREILEAWGRVAEAFAPNAKATDTPPLSPTERGRQKAKVTNLRDRELIRDEVKRISELSGMTQSEACRQVSEQAAKGMIRGRPVLSTTYYNLTATDVRRIFKSDW